MHKNNAINEVLQPGEVLDVTVDNAAGRIVMTNVLHHFPQPRLFFTEATRCVRSGGVIFQWSNRG